MLYWFLKDTIYNVLNTNEHFSVGVGGATAIGNKTQDSKTSENSTFKDMSEPVFQLTTSIV